MSGKLFAGAARRLINPPLGTRQTRAPRTTRQEAGPSTAYAVPDLIFQVHPHPVALHPASEQRAVDATLTLIRQLAPRGRS